MAGVESISESELDEYWTQCIHIYKGIIITVLRPFEMLLTGDFDGIIPRETERKIYKLDRDGQRETAAVTFIDALLYSAAVNKWNIFQDVIKREDHKFIQDIISGDIYEDVEVLKLHERAFRSVFREKLVEKLDPLETANKCYSQSLITKQEFEKVRKYTDNHGVSHGNLVLLSFIHCQRDWYTTFLKIIWEMDQKELVNYIDPDYYNKLVLQQEEGVNQDIQEAVMSYQGQSLSSANLNDVPEKEEKPFEELNNFDETDLKQSQVLNDSDLDDESNTADYLMLSESDKTTLKDMPFTLRSYQEELASSACQGKNVVICAPTGSGKTHVALQIIKEHMTSVKGRNSKVIFLVNQKALAEQQLNVLKDHLGVNHRCIQVSGDTELSIPLEKIVQTHDILVVTAQILVDAFRNEDIKSIRVFSLLVFDECHHTKDKHPFNSIMLKYIREKYPDHHNQDHVQNGMPQVVGLTASVGVGKAKSENDAVKHIRQLCANLDASEICIVQENKKELSSHTNTAEHSILPCQSRENDELKRLIDTLMKQIEEEMHICCEKANMKDLSSQLPHVGRRWSQAYSQWVAKMFKEIARIKDVKLRRKMESARRYLMICYTALTINEDCRSEDATRYLLDEVASVKQKEGNTFTPFEQELHEMFDRHKTVLQTANFGADFKNPKLNILHGLIRDCFKENSDSRAIIFVKTRELANALELWIRETEEIKWLNPRKMVGTGASAERGGMTQSQQIDVMTCFRKGRHKIIVATSVAQEGLDVTKCNMVIQYDYNTNEIAMVQARGRARAENSQYAVIASKESSVGEKEQINLMREKLMSDAIQILKSQMTNDPYAYEQMKRDYQFGKLGTWLLDEHSRQKNLKEGEFRLTCERCDQLACFSSDVRTVKSSQHIVIDPNFEDQIKVRLHPHPSTYVGMEKKGQLQCKNCSDVWGNVIKFRNHFYPVIKIEKFIVTDTFSSSKTYKRWKDVNFRILPLEISENTHNIDSLCDCLCE